MASWKRVVTVPATPYTTLSGTAPLTHSPTFSWGHNGVMEEGCHTTRHPVDHTVWHRCAPRHAAQARLHTQGEEDFNSFLKV